MQTIIFFLLFMSLFFTFLGGLTDITLNMKKNRNYKNDRNEDEYENHTFFISKEHLWNDGVYLLLLASFLQIYLNKNKN